MHEDIYGPQERISLYFKELLPNQDQNCRNPPKFSSSLFFDNHNMCQDIRSSHIYECQVIQQLSFKEQP